MVVARFWCDKVEEIKFNNKSNNYYIDRHTEENVYEITLGIASCLYHKELNNYLKEDNGYAIHITKLEIFDKPMCLNAFYYAREPRKDLGLPKNWKQIVTRPPQSFMFIEV